MPGSSHRGYQEAIDYLCVRRLRDRDVADARCCVCARESDLRRTAVMRTSLLARLAASARQQPASPATRARLFEVGRRYAGTDGAETEVIAGVVAGSAAAGAVGRRSDEDRFLRPEGRCRSVARSHRRARAIPLRSRASSRFHPVSRRAFGAASVPWGGWARCIRSICGGSI